jgi:hypothetical protein
LESKHRAKFEAIAGERIRVRAVPGNIAALQVQIAAVDAALHAPGRVALTLAAFPHTCVACRLLHVAGDQRRFIRNPASPTCDNRSDP